MRLACSIHFVKANSSGLRVLNSFFVHRNGIIGKNMIRDNLGCMRLEATYVRGRWLLVAQN